jgi:hypothetical protein
LLKKKELAGIGLLSLPANRRWKMMPDNGLKVFSLRIMGIRIFDYCGKMLRRWRAPFFPTGKTGRRLIYEASKNFGVIKANLEHKGKPIDDFDVAIAATAMSHQCAVLTANLQHFNRIENLEAFGW